MYAVIVKFSPVWNLETKRNRRSIWSALNKEAVFLMEYDGVCFRAEFDTFTQAENAIKAVKSFDTIEIDTNYK